METVTYQIMDAVTYRRIMNASYGRMDSRSLYTDAERILSAIPGVPIYIPNQSDMDDLVEIDEEGDVTTTYLAPAA